MGEHWSIPIPHQALVPQRLKTRLLPLRLQRRNQMAARATIRKPLLSTTMTSKLPNNAQIPGGTIPLMRLGNSGSAPSGRNPPRNPRKIMIQIPMGLSLDARKSTVQKRRILTRSCTFPQPPSVRKWSTFLLQYQGSPEQRGNQPAVERLWLSTKNQYCKRNGGRFRTT